APSMGQLFFAEPRPKLQERKKREGSEAQSKEKCGPRCIAQFATLDEPQEQQEQGQNRKCPEEEEDYATRAVMRALHEAEHKQRLQQGGAEIAFRQLLDNLKAAQRIPLG